MWRFDFPCPACGHTHRFVSIDESAEELYHFDCPLLHHHTQAGIQQLLAASPDPLQMIECPNPDCHTRVYARLSGECPACRIPFSRWSA